MPVISETNIFGAYIRSDLELQTGDTIFAKNISAYNNFNDNGKYQLKWNNTEYNK